MSNTSAVRAGRAFVELFADGSRLVRGLRAAEKKVVKFGQNIQAIGRRLFTIGMAVGGVLAVATKGFVSWGDALSKMSGRTGVAVSALSELAYAARQSGTDVATLESSLRIMQKNLASAFEGNDAAIKTLESLGISVAKLKRLSPDEQFTTLGEAISRIQDPTLRTAMAMRVFGKSGSQLLPMFADGASGINLLRERCRELGLTVNDLDAKNATRLSDALTDIWLTVKAVGFAVGAALAEPLLKFSEAVIACIAGTAKWINKNRELVVTAAKVTAMIIGIGAALFTTGVGFVGVGKTIGLVATGIASVTKVAISGLGLLTGAFKAIAVVGGTVISAFSGIFSLIGVALGTIMTGIGAAFSVLATVGTAAFSAIGAAIAAIISPVGLTILAIGAVAGACFLVYRNASAIKNAISTAFSAVTGAINTALSAVYRFLAGFTEFKILFATINIVSTAVKTLGGSFLWLARNIVIPVVGTIVQSLFWVGRVAVNTGRIIATAILSQLGKIVAEGWGIAKNLGAALASIAGTVAGTVRTALAAVGGTIIRTISPVINTVGKVISGVVSIISTLGNVLRTVVGWVIAFARSFFVVESVVQVFSLIKNAATCIIGIFSRVAKAVTSTLFTAVQNIPAVASRIFSFIAAIPGGVIGVFQKIPSVISGVFSGIVSVVRGTIQNISAIFSGIVSFMSGMWSGLVANFSTVFNTLSGIVAGFGNWFVGAISTLGTAVDWLRQQFGNLCSFAVETFGAIAAALGRGDIEAAIQMIWASIQLIWVKGSTSLLTTWYWVVDTLQTAWASCVYKLSEILTTAWYGVQEFWVETVYAMSTIWAEFAGGVVSSWKTAEKAVAKGIGYLIAQMQGLDFNELSKTIDEDYNRQSRQREAAKSQKLTEIQRSRDSKMSSLETDKQGVLDILKQDFEKAAGLRSAAYQAKLAAQEQELTAAKAAYNEAIERAKNPEYVGVDGENTQGTLLNRLRAKIDDVMAGLSFDPELNLDGSIAGLLESKITTSGSFSAFEAQSMGVGSTMDRVAKATEKSEKHLEKIVAKEEKFKEVATKKEPVTQESASGEDPTVRELKLQTRILRDLSSGGGVFV